MTMIDLGKIKFNWRGAYDPSQNYETDDVVSFDGSSYIATVSMLANYSPPNDGWDLMAQGNKPNPFLRMGSYGGWADTSTYPENTWNKLQCFEKISENRGGFIINNNQRVTLPKDGLYHLHCSAYAHSCEYIHTEIRVNGSDTIQGASTHTYWNGNSNSYFQHEWHDVVSLKAGDFVEFWFYQKSSVNDAYTIYHPRMHGSIIYLGE